eukprot:COSAG02_NODE_2850_length_7897_cov_2.970633_7_plen_568_part_00
MLLLTSILSMSMATLILQASSAAIVPATALDHWHHAQSWQKYAAISIVAQMEGDVQRVIGHTTKHSSNPLFVQDTPQESRIDNGYPNVVPPSSDGRDAAWQLWYGTCGVANQAILYANSTDGLMWQKPSLGRVTFGPKGNGSKQNNIVMIGPGTGVFRDEHAADPSQRYVAFGTFCTETDKPCSLCNQRMADCVEQHKVNSNLAISADGLLWTNATNLSWPFPHAYDCHNNIFRDYKTNRWIATTRTEIDFYPQNEDSERSGRQISMAATPGAALLMATGGATFDTRKPPNVTLPMTGALQLYSQVTWRWHNTFLGLVMVIDGQADPSYKKFGAGKVHCRLAFANQPLSEGVSCKRVGPNCTAAKPEKCFSQCTGHGGRPPLDSPPDGWNWVDAGGLNGTDFIEHGALGAFAQDPANAFDSHIIFAAMQPTTVGDKERVYYMGGNGPHSGARNSSFALATLRKDGYAALSGSGTVTTVPILCSGKHLTVTVDFDEAAPSSAMSLQVGVKSSAALGVTSAIPISANATDVAVRFKNGADFSKFVNKMVTIEMRLQSARVYTIGWTQTQ